MGLKVWVVERDSIDDWTSVDCKFIGQPDIMLPARR